MYTGPLTRDQVAVGRLAALKNAEDLFSDAMVLYRRRRWARAYFLSQIAVEEAGKYFYLFNSTVSVVEGSVSWPRFWKALRSHSDKTTMFLLMESAFVPAADDPKPIDEYRKTAKSIDRAKMWSLYADVEPGEPRVFFVPGMVIERRLASSAMRLAWNRVRLARRFEVAADWEAVFADMTPERVAQARTHFAKIAEEAEADLSGVRQSEA